MTEGAVWSVNIWWAVLCLFMDSYHATQITEGNSDLLSQWKETLKMWAVMSCHYCMRICGQMWAHFHPRAGLASGNTSYFSMRERSRLTHLISCFLSLQLILKSWRWLLTVLSIAKGRAWELNGASLTPGGGSPAPSTPVMKWSEVKWSEVKWSEVKWSVGKGEKETLWEKFIWVVKWWEVKGWGESVSTVCVGKVLETKYSTFLPWCCLPIVHVVF